MPLKIARSLALALCLSALATAPSAKNDPLHDYLMQQSSEHLGDALVNVANFVGLVSAVQLRPEILQQEIANCGNCPRRKRLDAELARANADKAALGQVGLTILDIGRATGVRDNVSIPDEWRLGRKSIPAFMADKSPLCKALWVQRMECEAAELDRSKAAWVCWDHAQLSNFACQNDMTRLASYVAIMKSRSEGRLTFVPHDGKGNDPRSGIYSNLRKETDIAMPADAGLKATFTARVNERIVGHLFDAQVSTPFVRNRGWRRPRVNPSFQTKLDQDYLELEKATPDARVLACRYYKATGTLGERVFWFINKPPMVIPALNERIPNHPLLGMGPVISHCPLTFEEAKAAFEGRSTAVGDAKSPSR